MSAIKHMFCFLLIFMASVQSLTTEIRESPNSLKTAAFNSMDSRTPAHFTQRVNTGDDKVDSTKQAESDVPPLERFMFVSQSKFPGISRSQISDDESTFFQNTSNEQEKMYERKGRREEERKTVTFDQAKEAITAAWSQCAGNPHCELMQILGGIDNTLELQEWLVEQITFLSKLFIIQRKLITDIFDEKKNIPTSDYKVTLSSQTLPSNSHKQIKDSSVSTKQTETKITQGRDYEKNILTKTELLDKDRGFKKVVMNIRTSHVQKVPRSHEKYFNKKSFAISKEQGEVKKLISKRFVIHPHSHLEKKASETEKNKTVINSSDYKMKPGINQTDLPLIDPKTGNQEIRANFTQEAIVTQGRNVGETDLRAPARLQDHSVETRNKRSAGHDQDNENGKKSSHPGSATTRDTHGEVKKYDLARNSLAWQFVDIGLLGILGGIFICVYMKNNPRDQQYKFLAFAALSLYILFAILAVQFISL